MCSLIMSLESSGLKEAVNHFKGSRKGDEGRVSLCLNIMIIFIFCSVLSHHEPPCLLHTLSKPNLLLMQYLIYY